MCTDDLETLIDCYLLAVEISRVGSSILKSLFKSTKVFES